MIHLKPGSVAPVVDVQACFRAVLDAMAHPGRVLAAGHALTPPAPLAPATAAVLLTLADADTPVFLDDTATEAADWVRFHCGAALADPAQAAFAVCLTAPSLTQFHWGRDDAPQDSATLILQRPALDSGAWFRLSGPGLAAPTTVQLGLPAAFAGQWHANHVAYPRGVDLILCAGTSVAALPRSVHVELA